MNLKREANITFKLMLKLIVSWFLFYLNSKSEESLYLILGARPSCTDAFNKITSESCGQFKKLQQVAHETKTVARWSVTL